MGTVSNKRMSNYQKSSFASRLKEAMEIRGKRQIDLSNETGILRGTISNYLKGRYEPKMQIVAVLAKHLHCNEMWLLGADVPFDRYYGIDKDDMEREQIIKALECCMGKGCKDCPYRCGNCTCISTLTDDALALIKELTEESDRLKELGTTKEIEKELVRRQTKADTVRKMQERLKRECLIDSGYEVLQIGAIDQIAKELLEEDEGK